MRSRFALLYLLVVLGCAGSNDSVAPAEAPPTEPAAGTPSAVPEEAAKPATPAADPNTAHIQVFALSDFHGWLLPLEPRGFAKYYGGIANLAGHLAHREKMRAESSLLLDNGDIWTGPTEATFLRGESVIQAYNALGMTAVNVANHEFDFGVEILRARVSEAKFPFLGANIVKAGTTENPDFVKPWVIVERDGVKVGVLGISYIDTPKTTLSKHVQGLEFQDYGATLTRVIPKMRAEGAEVIIVLFHDTIDVIEALMKKLPEMGIAAIIGGQNHRKGQTQVGSMPIINPGPFGRSYVRFDLDIERSSKKLLSVKHEIVDITGDVGSPAFPPSPELTAIAEAARQKAKGMSGEVLGRLAKPLPVGTFADSPLGHFVVDTWLSTLPDVDAAICNHGAIRQPLASGPVTMGDLMGVMPFENNLYIVHITGKQIREVLAIDGPVVGGITWSYRETKSGRQVVSIVDRKGGALDDIKKYSVAINDFMYLGGDGFPFKDMDATPEDTGLSWRQPVIRTLRLAETTSRKIEPQSTARARHVK